MEYTFNGEWEFSLRLDKFNEYQCRESMFGNLGDTPIENRKLGFSIEDELSEEADPLIEQVNAINYVLNNQDEIIDVIYEKVKAEFAALVEAYDYVERPFDTMQSKEEFKKITSIDHVNVLTAHKDGYSYVGFSCGCSWDEEHGLGLLMHKGRIVAFGEAATSFDTWEAYKDNGTEHDTEKEQQKLLEIPIKYKPHPKYNNLKPSQKSANECFVFYLITRGHTDIFIQLAEHGEIDISAFHKPSDDTCLELACSANNLLLANYLLAKKVAIRYALHKCRRSGDDTAIFELLLASGADINAQDMVGDTIVKTIVDHLGSVYNSKVQRDAMGIENDLGAQAANLKNEISKLIKRGCDPYIKNMYGVNCFDVMRNFSAELQEEVNGFIRDCLTN